VKNSRLQLLTVKFENLMMGEDQSVHDFHMTILDFANNFDALGEKLSEERMVRKMLRSLPKMFDMKVTTIEEVHDIGVMKLENLVGSLLTYELAAKEKTEKWKKSIALVTNTTESEEVENGLETDENLSETMAHLGRQFNRILKKMDGRGRTNAKGNFSDNNRKFNGERKYRPEEKASTGKGVQCHECEGHGHIRAECPTFLKKQKKGMAVTWSDEDDS
jgi:hypothetical protein